MVLLCSKKEKNARSARECPQKDDLTEGNTCGHRGEALAKLIELIAGPDKLLDTTLLIIWQGNHTMTQDKICKHWQTVQNDSSTELHSDTED